jgi:hypothetical protein
MILIENPVAGKAGQKNTAKMSSANSLQWKNVLAYFRPNKFGVLIIRQSGILPFFKERL